LLRWAPLSSPAESTRPMRSSTFRFAVLALPCSLALWAGSASAALVTLKSELIEAAVPGEVLTGSPLTIPADGVVVAANSFGNSRIERSFQTAADVTTLGYQSSYSRNTGAPSASALFNRSLSVLTFSVDQNATYSLFGAMAVNDPISGAGPTYGTSSFMVYLIDITNAPPATVLMNSNQSLTSVEDASFALGDSGLIGSLTGSLQAGRTYEFLYRSRVETPVNTQYGSMTALGRVELKITAAATEPPPPGTPLPEPGTLALMLAAALGLAVTRRR
jgi:hypothetical protein